MILFISYPIIHPRNILTASSFYRRLLNRRLLRQRIFIQLTLLSLRTENHDIELLNRSIPLETATKMEDSRYEVSEEEHWRAREAVWEEEWERKEEERKYLDQAWFTGRMKCKHEYEPVTRVNPRQARAQRHARKGLMQREQVQLHKEALLREGQARLAVQNLQQREQRRREADERAEKVWDEDLRRERVRAEFLKHKQEEQELWREAARKKEAKYQHKVGLQCQMLKNWISRCDECLAAEKRAGLTVLPLLPAWICKKCRPTAVGISASHPCACRLEELFAIIFRENDQAYFEAVNKERKRWHPDRFTKCSWDFLADYEEMVTEMSKLFNKLHEKATKG